MKKRDDKTPAYFRIRAGEYSFKRHRAQRFYDGDLVYWQVTNEHNGERVKVDNFHKVVEYIQQVEGTGE